MKYIPEYEDVISSGRKSPFAGLYNSINDAAEYVTSVLEKQLIRNDMTFLVIAHNDADGLGFPANLELLKEKCGTEAKILTFVSDLFGHPPMEFFKYIKEQRKNIFILTTDTSIYPPLVSEEMRKSKKLQQIDPLKTIENLLIETKTLPETEQPQLMIIDHHVPPGVVEKDLSELKEKVNIDGKERVHVVDLKYGIKGLEDNYPCIGGFSYLVCNKLAEIYGLSSKDLEVNNYNLFAIPSLISLACDDRLTLTDEIYKKIFKENPKVEEIFSYKATYPIWIACNAQVNSLISIESNAKRPLSQQDGAIKAKELIKFAAKNGDPFAILSLKSRYPKEKAMIETLERVERISYSLDSLLNEVVKPLPLLIPGSRNLGISTCIINGNVRVEANTLSDFKVNRGIVYTLSQKAKQRIKGKRLPEVLTVVAYGGIVVPDAIIETPFGMYCLPFMEHSARRLYVSKYNYKTHTTENIPAIELTPYKMNIGLGCLNRIYLEFERWEEGLKKGEISQEQFEIYSALFRGGGSDTAGAVKLPLYPKETITQAIIKEEDLAREAFSMDIKEKGFLPAIK